jgi:predicted Zn-dependent protease
MRAIPSRRSVFVILGALISLLGLTVANAQLVFSRKEIERESRTAWLLMKKQTPIHPDERVQEYVRCVANEIINVLDPEWQALNWEVIVFDVDGENAAVLPGGKIQVWSGMLRIADTQDALAAVLGHEIAHLTEDHTIQRARSASRTSLAGIVGQAATGLHRSYFELGANLGLHLPHQRQNETEADLVGLQYMAKAGFDPRAGITLWQTMLERQRQNREMQPAEFVSTHPAAQTRIDDMIENLVPNLTTFNEARAAGHYPNCYPDIQ